MKVQNTVADKNRNDKPLHGTELPTSEIKSLKTLHKIRYKSPRF